MNKQETNLTWSGSTIILDAIFPVISETMHREELSDPSNNTRSNHNSKDNLSDSPEIGYCKHVAKDAPRSAVGREVRGACGGGGGPAWNETRLIYDPPAAPPPRTPLERARQLPQKRTNQRGGQRPLYVFRFEGWCDA